jgi:hypothetical protein
MKCQGCWCMRMARAWLLAQRFHLVITNWPE